MWVFIQFKKASFLGLNLGFLVIDGGKSSAPADEGGGGDRNWLLEVQSPLETNFYRLCCAIVWCPNMFGLDSGSWKDSLSFEQ